MRGVLVIISPTGSPDETSLGPKGHPAHLKGGFKMKALITGVTGFVGSHLADYLIDQQGVEVHGIRRPRSRTEFLRYDVHYHEGDVTDLHAMEAIMEAVKPNFVFHLAAQSFVPLSWRAPSSTLTTNIIGTLHTLEAVRRECPSAVVQVAGSSEEYGLVIPEECPVNENQPLRPQSPYGVSKVAADLLAQQYHKSYGIKVIITRSFNSTGPRRGEVFICSKIAKALVEQGGADKPVLQLGNLEAVRDFTDVRDIVVAYWFAVNECEPGIPYNIGTGKGYTIQQIVDLFAEIISKPIAVEQDSKFMRPSDVPLLICDSTSFRSATDWMPTIPFKQSLRDLLEYWRKNV